MVDLVCGVVVEVVFVVDVFVVDVEVVVVVVVVVAAFVFCCVSTERLSSTKTFAKKLPVLVWAFEEAPPPPPPPPTTRSSFFFFLEPLTSHSGVVLTSKSSLATRWMEKSLGSVFDGESLLLLLLLLLEEEESLGRVFDGESFDVVNGEALKEEEESLEDVDVVDFPVFPAAVTVVVVESLLSVECDVVNLSGSFRSKDDVKEGILKEGVFKWKQFDVDDDSVDEGEAKGVDDADFSNVVVVVVLPVRRSFFICVFNK